MGLFFKRRIKMDEVTDTISASTAKLIDGITPAMKALADKFGTTAEHLYIVLCKQSLVDGVGYLIISAICLLLLGGFIYAFKLLLTKCQDWLCYHEKVACMVICAILATVCMMVGLTDMVLGMKHVVNPEYYAVKEVLKNIK
jgi:hypothetical protein